MQETLSNFYLITLPLYFVIFSLQSSPLKPWGSLQMGGQGCLLTEMAPFFALLSLPFHRDTEALYAGKEELLFSPALARVLLRPDAVP